MGVRPEHEVASANVDVPTIMVRRGRHGREEVVTQWFGDSSDCDVSGMQFFFPLPLSQDAMEWRGNPELFTTVMLGQIKDWPNPDAVRSLAHALARGSTDAWIIWVASADAVSD